VTTPDVRAMTARYGGYCAVRNCAMQIRVGELIYRVNGQSMCHLCGRRFVDSLPIEPRKPRPE
jgi:hypothetical protein